MKTDIFALGSMGQNRELRNQWACEWMGGWVYMWHMIKVAKQASEEREIIQYIVREKSVPIWTDIKDSTNV